MTQTKSVDEIIVCDDCSTDQTIEILKEYQVKYPAIFKIFKNEINLKSNKNFEKAISLTSGDFIFLSDQDDVWRKDKVEKTLAIFYENPDAEGVFTDANFIDDNSKPILNNISLWESVCFFKESIKERTDLYASLINIGNFLTGATLCIKSEVKSICIPFQTIDCFIHDEWFAYLLSNRKTLYFSSEKLISYRLHNAQQVGIGKIRNSDNRYSQNQLHNFLMLETKEPQNYRQFKAKARAHFSQYEKYYQLYQKYGNPQFKEISDSQAKKFIEADRGMKNKNSILYFIRKLLDKQKGRRQLK